MLDALQALGRATLGFFERLGRGHLFLLQTLASMPGVLLRPRLVLAQLYSVGVRTLVITLVSGMFVGMVLGLQGYNTLVDFGAEESLGVMVALSLVRDTALGAFLVRRFNAFSAIAARVAFKKPVPPEVRAAYTLPYDTPDNRIATLKFVQDIPLGERDPGYDILLNTSKRLHLFADKPCLIAWGEKDFVFDAPFLDTWLEYLPEAQVLRFPDCGHYILEDGGPALIRQIANFIGIRDDSNNGQDRG